MERQRKRKHWIYFLGTLEVKEKNSVLEREYRRLNSIAQISQDQYRKEF